MKLERLTLRLLSENCYIYYNNGECIIFDPGSDFEYIKAYIDKHNLKVNSILLTHCHFDHIGAVSQLKKHYNTKVMCHQEDLMNLNTANRSMEYYGLGSIEIPEIDKFVIDNELIPFQDTVIKVIHTPGHTKGSVCYYMEQDKYLISGDTLFLESVGRTDFPGGSHEELMDSIQNKIYTLPNDVTVFPGHGFHTTIEHEKENNPFVQGDI